MLTYSEKHNLFVWKGRFPDRHIPRKAGFEFKYNNWVTASPYVAFKLYSEADQLARPKLKQIYFNVRNSYSLDDHSNIPAPDGLEYMPFQKGGIWNLFWQANTRKHLLLADEQGLGKTIQAIGFANMSGFKKILVICPASLGS